jgi:hypothetical protein
MGGKGSMAWQRSILSSLHIDGPKFGQGKAPLSGSPLWRKDPRRPRFPRAFPISFRNALGDFLARVFATQQLLQATA